MARTGFRSSNHMSRVFCGLGLLCLLLVVNKASAREFVVGGSSGWSVPSQPQSYNQWAEKNRFQIGDSLLFVYQSDKDSVLKVTGDAYANCNTDAPIEKFTDGHTSVAFNSSGPYYFISGNKDNCQKNEKILVVVMADRSNASSSTPPPSSSPPSPSPAPYGDEAPPTPDNGPVSLIPAPAPSEEPNPSSAPFVFADSVGFSAAILASFMILLI